MNFSLILSAEVAAYLNGMPWPMIEQVQTALERLAASPTSESRPSEPPLMAGALMFDFAVWDANHVQHVGSVSFRYGQDEQSLYILELTVR